MTVLVVDDADMIADLMVEVLALDGVTAVRVHEPRDLLDEHSPLWADATVLLCDLRMPGISGLEILAVARRFHPHIFTIALTGYDDPEAQRVLTDLADVVKAKPNDVLDVVAIIKAYADGR